MTDQVNFFSYQDFIPESMGYTIGSGRHLLCLLLTGLLMGCLIFIFIKTGNKERRRIRKAIPLLFLLLEGLKQVVLFTQGKNDVGMLPLHLCGLAAYEYLLAEYLPGKRLRAFFGEAALILFAPGALAALILPDWTMYPVVNFFNLYGYLWHGLVVVYPFLLLQRREIHLSIRHIWYEVLILLVLVPPISLFNKRFGTNYLFISWPVPGSPLEWLASFMGVPGYLIGYAGLVLSIMTGEYLFEMWGVRIYRSLRKRP